MAFVFWQPCFVVFCCLGGNAGDRGAPRGAGDRQFAYAHTPALPNPRRDAQDMADTLRRVGFEVTFGLRSRPDQICPHHR